MRLGHWEREDKLLLEVRLTYAVHDYKARVPQLQSGCLTSTHTTSMSSPQPEQIHVNQAEETDDPMQGLGQEGEEGEGDEIAPNLTDDSSEEGEDDEEEARRIREGFIVDEDEDEEEDEEKEERRRRRKRRKKHHRRREYIYICQPFADLAFDR